MRSAAAVALLPYELDEIIERSGVATSESFDGVQKRYRTATQLSKATTSRHFNGYLHAPTTRFLVQVATADGGTGFPIIAEGLALLNQKQIEMADTRVLEARIAVLDDEEHDVQALSARQTQRAIKDPSAQQQRAAARADIKEAAIGLERAAIRFELAKRKERPK